jgi:hypothetical protein
VSQRHRLTKVASNHVALLDRGQLSGKRPYFIYDHLIVIRNLGDLLKRRNFLQVDCAFGLFGAVLSVNTFTE